jgi:hypothetical protein
LSFKRGSTVVFSILFLRASLDEGRAMLAKVPMTDIVATSLDDYLVIEKWGLERYFDPMWSED